jgi:Family of unknown function (DUF6502)
VLAPPSTPTIPDADLIAAVELILRPLVRLFLEQGLVFGTAEELLKTAYVRVADAEYRLRDEPPTDSRVSVLSGVHRKDVRRLRDPGIAAKRPPVDLPFASEVVTRWISDARYLDARHNPRVLPRVAEPPAPSFDELVIGISKDVRPRVLLDELVRLGVAAKTKDGSVELLVSAFVPQKDYSQRVFYLGRNIHDHLAACVHNLVDREPSMMEQSVFSFELSDASVEKVAEIARHEWKQVVGRLIRELGDCETHDRLTGDTSRRMNIGMYFFHESADSPASHGSPRQRRRAAPGHALAGASGPKRRSK